MSRRPVQCPACAIGVPLSPRAPNLILCQSLEHKTTFSPHPAGMGVLRNTVDEGALSCHCPGFSQPSLCQHPYFPAPAAHLHEDLFPV